MGTLAVRSSWHLAWQLGLAAAFAVVVATLLGPTAQADLLVAGSVDDKQEFLSYLNLFGGDLGGVTTPFSYSTNVGIDGPSVLAADPDDVLSHFGSRMAAAVASLDNPGTNLTVAVGRNLPRVFFGAFRYDPGPPPVAQSAAHQTIDLADLARLGPYSRVDHLLGATDVILHEVFEGIAGLASPFEPAHTSGIQEENSNRAAEDIRGVRRQQSSTSRGTPLVDRLAMLQQQGGFAHEVSGDPTQDDSVWFIHKTTGDFLYFTPWDILDPSNDPGLTKEGWLQISGTLVGAANAEYTIKDVQFGTTPLGGDYGIDSFTEYDVQVDSVTFFIPEPPTGALAFLAIAIGVVLGRFRAIRTFPKRHRCRRLPFVRLASGCVLRAWAKSFVHEALAPALPHSFQVFLLTTHRRVVTILPAHALRRCAFALVMHLDSREGRS